MLPPAASSSSSTYLEELANTGVVVFDKTGTLTQGTFKVTGIHPAEGVTDAALVEPLRWQKAGRSTPSP